MSHKRVFIDDDGSDTQRKPKHPQDLDTVLNALSRAVHAHKTEKAITIMTMHELSCDVKMPMGIRPLICCAHSDNVAFARWLVENGATIDLVSMGYTPLGFACRVGAPGVAQYLVKNGAATEPKHLPLPLVQASIYGHDMIVYALLAAGAKKDARDPSTGKTVLMFAKEHGHSAIVRLLQTAD